MISGLSDAIRSIVDDKGISESLIFTAIEDFLLAAYKKKFGTTENAVVKFSEEKNDVALYAEKTVVDGVYEDFKEIQLEEALEINPDCEIDDILLFEIDPAKEFSRVEIQSAKQKAKMTLREIQKDSLYSEFSQKEGEMIIGYYQRENNGNIFIDIGNTEGILPQKYQSPREKYKQNDRIKTYIHEVSKNGNNVSVVLSRSHSKFVEKLFEVEVPEIDEKIIEIMNVVREPGFRTKMAVYSKREDVDPVGSCVGVKGVRIQSVIKELEGEKIDVIRYDSNPRIYIANALSPAEVQFVHIADVEKKQAYAVVQDSQLSLAIGKQGQNVRLANRLVDWNIDVKTLEQFEELGLTEESSANLFKDAPELVYLRDIYEIPEKQINALSECGIELIEDFVNLDDDQLTEIEGLTKDEIQEVFTILNASIDFVDDKETVEDDSEVVVETEEEVEEEYEEIETYECPECGSDITTSMTTCPNCGVGFSFEDDDDTEDEIEE